MKRKNMIVFFAVFAATLMLMTTCIAQPVQQSVSIEAVESTAVGTAQQELMSSVEATALKMKNDPVINSFVGKISSDTTFISKVSAIANTPDPNKQMSLVTSLKAYISSKYSVDLQKISASLSKNYGISPGAIDSAKSTLSGFMHSTNGSIYVPGIGWVSPTNPYYNYWLSLENYLQGSGSDLQDIFVFILLWLVFLTPPGYIIEEILLGIWWTLGLIISLGMGLPIYILLILSDFFMAPIWLYVWYFVFKYNPWPWGPGTITANAELISATNK